MNIPTQYQIFDGPPVVVCSKDEERLKPYLRGVTPLTIFFARKGINGINEPDLKRLLIMELLDRRREPIVSRIISRLVSHQRAALKKRIRAVAKLVPAVPHEARKKGVRK